MRLGLYVQYSDPLLYFRKAITDGAIILGMHKDISKLHKFHSSMTFNAECTGQAFL